MSSLIRGEAVAVLGYGAARMADATTPRVFGARVLRGDHVGIQRPFPLAAPANVRGDEAASERVESGLAADPSAVEQAARLQGYSAGHEEGYAAGLAAAEAAMADQLGRLAALVSSVQESHAGFFRAAERQVVDLALQIAAKVVEREVENLPDLAVGVIRAALEEMDARTAVRVRVNPDDAELLRRRWTQVVPSGIGADRIELQPDDRVAAGGAIIETNHGQVDAQLQSKLEQLGNALWTFVMDVNNSQDQEEAIDA